MVWFFLLLSSHFIIINCIYYAEARSFQKSRYLRGALLTKGRYLRGCSYFREGRYFRKFFKHLKFAATFGILRYVYNSTGACKTFFTQICVASCKNKLPLVTAPLTRTFFRFPWEFEFGGSTVIHFY